MHFLAIIIAIILIAMFWRLFAGLAVAAVALALVIGGGVWLKMQFDEHQKVGHWTLTIDHIKDREACERRKADILTATKKARAKIDDMWRVSAHCD
jgi:hypothetical protein